MNARSTALWLLLAAASLRSMRTLLPSAVAHLTDPGFEAVLLGGCELALVACASWAWVCTTAVLVGARRGVPSGVRRVVLLACGLAVTGVIAVPAHAGDGQRDRVAGLPLPQRPVGALVLVERAVAAATPVTVVRSGDSLWSLAEEHLEDPAAWPRLYAANRSVVGPDPDLVHPGQHLRLPATPKEPS